MKTLERLVGQSVGHLAGHAAGLLLALAVLAPPAHAQSKEALELAGRLFERSGLAAQLESLPAQFEQAVAESRGQVSDDVLQALADAGKISYSTEALRAEIVPLFARKLPEADMKRALAWLDSDAGRRITRAEESASGRMTKEVLQAFQESRKGKPASATRVKLLADLDLATDSVEISAIFIEAMSLGIAVGLDASQPEENRIGIAGVRARLRTLMPPDKLRAEIAESMPTMDAYAYRDIDDADLAAYLKFNRSPSGKRYNRAVAEVLAEAFAGANVRIGELIGAHRTQI
jgi:hypothetical protein